LEQGFAAIIRDVSQRKALERDRAQSQAFLDTVVTNLPAMLFVKDSVTREYIMVNHAAEQVIGRTASALVGATDGDLFPAYSEAYERRDTEAIAAGKPHIFESAFVREDGETVHLRTTRSLIDGPDRPNQYILGVSENVTETRRAEAEILRLAQYDPLTGLLNRASYTERLHTLVQTHTPFAMLSIDLDRFKAVNDQFGHPTGDMVLVQVSERLSALLGPGDWIARIGGDEFMAVLTGGGLRERARDVADGIISALTEPIYGQRSVASVGASIGAVLMPQDGTSTEQLRENVDLALYRAKQTGRGSVCFFNAEMDAAARDRRTLEQDLRLAIGNDEIALFYQPVLAAADGKITSAEALARWTHATRGPIRPDIFISLAEECGLIDDLGEKLLRRACVDAQSWPEHIRVAVNLSPLQFLSGKLLGTVEAALAEAGLMPNRLQLEVTEGLVIRDVERTFSQLEELRTLGIQVLIDDFGVGYSSLSYFQRFTFDKVKLDKSFVDEITTSRAARAIVHAVVGLGRELGMGIVAEGVETEEQMRLLTSYGCTHLQGYLFSCPVPEPTLRTLLHAPTSSRQNLGSS
jgi:diguanylate cyclase (GGDEF)-like protein/PAS domain S-box-containing protein